MACSFIGRFRFIWIFAYILFICLFFFHLSPKIYLQFKRKIGLRGEEKKKCQNYFNFYLYGLKIDLYLMIPWNSSVPSSGRCQWRVLRCCWNWGCCGCAMPVAVTTPFYTAFQDQRYSTVTNQIAWHIGE